MFKRHAHAFTKAQVVRPGLESMPPRELCESLGASPTTLRSINNSYSSKLPSLCLDNYSYPTFAVGGLKVHIPYKTTKVAPTSTVTT